MTLRLTIEGIADGDDSASGESPGSSGTRVGRKAVAGFSRLRWHGAPDGTKSFAITCYDPSTYSDSRFWDWVVVNIPAHVMEMSLSLRNQLSPQLPAGALQTRTDLPGRGHYGPGPTAGDASERHLFALFAVAQERLRVTADTPALAVCVEVSASTLEKTTLLVTYSGAGDRRTSPSCAALADERHVENRSRDHIFRALK